jgi:hypothetical protein
MYEKHAFYKYQNSDIYDAKFLHRSSLSILIDAIHNSKDMYNMFDLLNKEKWHPIRNMPYQTPNYRGKYSIFMYIF